MVHILNSLHDYDGSDLVSTVPVQLKSKGRPHITVPFNLPDRDDTPSDEIPAVENCSSCVRPIAASQTKLKCNDCDAGCHKSCLNNGLCRSCGEIASFYPFGYSLNNLAQGPTRGGGGGGGTSQGEGFLCFLTLL